MPKPKLKRIPKFASEAAEQEFWATADTTEYFDWSKARRVVFPNLKPTTTPADHHSDFSTVAGNLTPRVEAFGERA